MSYNYRAQVKQDVFDYVSDWYNNQVSEPDEVIDFDFDELLEECQMSDSITGNASGSYYCNAYKAEEALAHNWDILRVVLSDFGYGLEMALEQGAEWCDVIIRYYYVYECLVEVLEELGIEYND